LKLDLLPIEENRHDWLPLVLFGLAVLFGVVIFLPPEGSVGVPLHELLVALLGRAAFLLPVGLLVAGVLLLTRALRPNVRLPYRRLLGVSLMTVAVLAMEHFFAGSQDGTGRIGEWLSMSLLDLVGGPATGVLLVLVLGVGVVLAFDVRLQRRVSARDAAKS
jgi:4TM region of DNA translocase FtsK/SpoIIIE